MNEAALDWQDGQPYSKAFGDIYFSRESGIAETRHVFLQHNRLQERWAKLAEESFFVIGETGFGAGLNFLCAWQLWLVAAPSKARLHFVSTELHPLSSADMQRALGLWPELMILSDALMAQYQVLSPGWHRMTFVQGRVTLTLLIGDARDTLPQLNARVDAWFLDGFAPAKNPEMWSDRLLQAIGRLSNPDATFATFTSAGAVRRGLQASGFIVEKGIGFGKKREILYGTRDGVSLPKSLHEKHVIIVGGGIAGTATAHSLSLRGWRVTLIERHPKLAAEASGNRQGVLYARLSPKWSALGTLTLACYLYTLRRLSQLFPKGENTWQQCGVLQLAFNEAEITRQQALLHLNLSAQLVHQVSREQATQLAGIDVNAGGLYFPTGGWINPPALCEALVNAPTITILQHEVTELKQVAEQWQVWGEGGLLESAPVLILAGAASSNRFVQTAHLPLRSVRGQVSHLNATIASQQLNTVICGEGFLTPQRAGDHTLGSSYQDGDSQTDVREQDHIENLAMLRQLSPSLYQSLGAAPVTGRAACRCSVPSNLPVVGEVSVELPGLYVNTGHSSRGLVTGLLIGEVLAASIEREPAPLPQQLLKAISPLRFQ